MNRETVEKLIADALEYDKTYSVQSVIDEVNAGRAEIWLTDNSIALTNVMDKPNARICHIWIAAGDLDELMPEIYPALEDRARQVGCALLTISGRRGWIRALKPNGFNEVATVGVKELT